MHTLPTGTVTFLFTDMEGSTQLLTRLKDDYAGIIADLRSLLRTAFLRWKGQEIDTQGDAFFVAFSRASDAINAVVEMQHALANHPWPQAAKVLVRMGLHTGEPTLTGSGYIGIDVHRAARICAVGYGGQVLLSASTQTIVDQDLPPGISLRFLGEHRLKDLQRPEHIYQIVFEDLPSDFPLLKSLDARPNNLPVQLTSFIGREREIKQVEKLIGRARLVTLTGPGGAGKTRLALQVGADRLDGFRDGVWFVELAPLTDGALIPKAIASALKVREDTHQSLVDTLVEALSSQSLLLILDNCEHLVDATAHTADELLHRCPNLKILATSREALNIPGEVTFIIPSLSLPGEWSSSQLETLNQYEAVRLFIDRAVAWQPAFTVTNQNAPTLAQICAHLDGIPLAIELAAARVRSLSLEQIGSHLNDRFRLLRSSSRTISPRQQTLEAAIDWSYDLLSEKERILFRRLAVFSGGWTLDFAEKICKDALLAAEEILELQSRLVEKSLVVFDGEKPRYHFLESLRQYALARLVVSGEAERLYEVFFSSYYQLVLGFEPKIRAVEQVEILNCLELEQDNLRAALNWAFESNCIEEAADLVAAMSWFWFLRNYPGEGTQWAVKAVAASPGITRRAQARAHYALGFLSWSTNQYSLAKSALTESFQHFQACRDKVGSADALHMLGHVVLDQGNHVGARSYFNRSATLYRELNDRVGLLPLVGDLGLIAYLNREFDQALQLFQEHLKLSTSLNNQDNISSALNRLGDLARCKGEQDQAEKYYRESLAIVEDVGVVSMVSSLKHNLAHVAKNRGNFALALQLFHESMAQFQANEDKKGMVECLEGIAEVAVGMDRPEDAACLFGAAESLRNVEQVQWWPANQIAYEKSVTELKQKIDQDILHKEWSRGSVLTLEQMVSLAQSLG